MNYYIQGDAARAEEIKAAFEKLGYDVSGFDMCNDNILFFTYKLQGGGKVISTTNANLYTANIIKTHPDYKELELPVEPKFKKWDWIACDADSFTLSIKSVKDGNYYFHQGASLPIKDIDEHYHLWTIQDAKDGDVLVTTKIRSCPFIYRRTDRKDNLAYYYAGIDGNGDFSEDCLKRTLYHFGSVSDVIPATKEQRDLLFAKMKEAGYEWDANKKELRKIKPHYDIKNFKPFQKVLVRDDDNECWMPSLFGWFDSGLQDGKFVCGTSDWEQCIPFNDDTKHLLGTTDMCSEEYINW